MSTNSNTFFSIGIDIGGTNTDIGLVNANGVVIARSNLRTAQYFDAQLFVNDMVDVVRKLMLENNIEKITGIGIGAPCGNFHEGTIEDAKNLNFRGKTPLKKMIEAQLHVPIIVTNDANAAVYGEMIYGGAKGMKDVVMFTLGTGVGGGIIIAGKLLYGSDGFAGELGHATLVPFGRKCTCGNAGCLEMYASIRGIMQTCVELLEQFSENELAKIPREALGLKIIADAAYNGNAVAIETYRKTGEWLGIALANAVAFSSPEAIFLMGGIVKAGEILLKPTRESFAKHKLFIYKNDISVLTSQLNENDAAILGAASLVINKNQ
ncbi:MAG: ROK family protein [Bacteroidetes bacterium]|nr:ROK family protein [Bacteroidota bacterium]MCL2301986.1 ROK family protein [Lentimicrobiaceae bacterium]